MQKYFWFVVSNKVQFDVLERKKASLKKTKKKPFFRQIYYLDAANWFHEWGGGREEQTAVCDILQNYSEKIFSNKKTKQNKNDRYIHPFFQINF